MCPGAAECAFNQEQKSRSWACPQHPDGSIAPPGCRSWAGLPWGWGQPARSPSYGEGSTLHPPALLAHYPSQPVYLAAGLVIADPGHPTSSAGCQRSVPALTATSPFSDTLQEDANRTRSRILAERARMYRSRATQEVSVDTGWRKDVYQRHLRAQERHELTVDSPTPASQDQLVGTSLEAVRSQMEHEARVTQKMQQAKAALQCSRIWDIPGRLLEQQKSSADLEQCIKEGEEKKRALAERLHELELNLAKLKFHQPSNTSRVLEEELRLKLQCQEARLEDMRAQMMRSKDVLLKCEEDIDSLFVRLQGITVPGQEDPVKAMAVEEKLQHCEQKLRYLVQRVASLPHDWRSPNKDNKIFAEVRNLLENTTADHPQNLRVSLEDAGSGQGRRAQRGHVPQQPSQPLPVGIPGHPCLSSTVPAEPNPRAACPRCCGTRRESLGFKITWLWPPPVGCSWGRPRAFGSSLLCF
ncbi:coiled-coil domain-containing protein 183-like isoform X4 [Falco biarmicus]|uniref:coiled-coil domain-containing protein 183-like isoform X4 n=1 Tax=Falco biarmicus TaxID=345155 RepID=UPI0024BBFDD1|nr:coiled-coil domain-containing protein 183-like isoform X4 [Falco biarmicus]